MKELMVVKEEVREALKNNGAVIALESTIISHGMPYPGNIETALAAEKIARDLGAVPATIGILGGKLRIGLEEQEIEKLGREKDVLKVSRRDLSYALAEGLNGATTVSATMIAAHLAGIRVFATGGIGGVHHEAEKTFDISADLLELSRTPVMVVSAGAKAILDLPRTLEFLETHGIPVIGFRTDEFPAFFSRTSGLRVGLVAESVREIATMYEVHRRMGLEQGFLVANPVPEQDEIPQNVMEGYIEQALKELKAQGIGGKEVTPFLLARIVELSGGKSLETNIALLYNNVRLACELSRELVLSLSS